MAETNAAPAAPKRSTWEAIAVFLERRSLVMLMLGFAAGLPNLLLYDTISAWMRQAKLPLDVITLFSLVTATYAIKFLWAPIVDRLKIPVLYQLFGKRRSWMLLAQIGIVFGIWAIAVNMPAVSAGVAGGAEGAVQPDPNMDLIGVVAILATMTAVFGATQDIAIDAWRIEVAAVERQGAMAAAYQWGYRLAVVVSGAAPLFLASRIGWTAAYSAMALVMAIGIVGVLLAPREQSVEPKPLPPQTTPAWMEALEWIARAALMAFAACFIGAGLSGKPEPISFMFPWIGLVDATAPFAEVWASKPWGAVWQVVAVAFGLGVVAFATYPMFKSRPSAYFAGTLKEPLEDFFKRYGVNVGALILAMICVYRIADFVLNLMTAFYVDVGFSLDEIAGARKLFGVVMSMLGIGLGGWLVARFGLMRSLLVGAIVQPLSNIAFSSLIFTGPWLPGLYICIAIDNISAGIAGTALIAYMSSLTSRGFTATQYALFSSLYALPGKILAAVSGRIVEGATAAAAAGESNWLRGWFTNIAPDSLAHAEQEYGRPAEAFAAGYMTFFIYSGVIGALALIFAISVMRQSPPATDEAKEEPAPA